MVKFCLATWEYGTINEGDWFVITRVKVRTWLIEFGDFEVGVAILFVHIPKEARVFANGTAVFLREYTLIDLLSSYIIDFSLSIFCVLF
jgi:hypothetical protein